MPYDFSKAAEKDIVLHLKSAGYYIDSDGAYHVYTPDGLQSWADSLEENPSNDVYLLSDIEFERELPSSTFRSTWNSPSLFTGRFYGNGKTIKNIAFEGTSSQSGFINKLQNAYIYYVCFKDFRIKNDESFLMGVFSGEAEGTTFIASGIDGGTIENNGTVSGNFAASSTENSSYNYFYGCYVKNYKNANAEEILVGYPRSGDAAYGCFFSGEITSKIEGEVRQSTGCWYYTESTGYVNGWEVINQEEGHRTADALESMNRALSSINYEWVLDVDDEFQIVHKETEGEGL